MASVSCDNGHRENAIAQAGEASLNSDELDLILPRESGSFGESMLYQIVGNWADENVIAQAAVDMELDKRDDVVIKLEEARRMILISAFEQEVIIPRIEIDSLNIREFYDERVDDYIRTRDEVKCEHLLVSSQELADSIETLMDTLSFDEIRKNFAENSAVQMGDNLGYLSREDMHPAIARRVFKLSDGEVAGPIETEYGFHFIKLLDFAPKGSIKEFDMVKQDIENILMDQEFHRIYNELLDSLSQAKPIIIDSAFIESRSNDN